MIKINFTDIPLFFASRSISLEDIATDFKRECVDHLRDITEEYTLFMVAIADELPRRFCHPTRLLATSWSPKESGEELSLIYCIYCRSDKSVINLCTLNEVTPVGKLLSMRNYPYFAPKAGELDGNQIPIIPGLDLGMNPSVTLLAESVRKNASRIVYGGNVRKSVDLAADARMKKVVACKHRRVSIVGMGNATTTEYCHDCQSHSVNGQWVTEKTDSQAEEKKEMTAHQTDHDDFSLRHAQEAANAAAELASTPEVSFAKRPEKCLHLTTIDMKTSDGIMVEFCQDCGSNSINGVWPSTSPKPSLPQAQEKPELPTSLSPKDIDDVIIYEQYEVIGSSTITICTLTLRNGAKVVGHNYGSIDPSRQNWDIGRQEAKKKAVEKVWELEGYLLRQRLFEAGVVQG